MKEKISSKAILAKNLRALMDKNGHSEGYVHGKTKIAQSTVGRILRCESSATTDSVDAIAKLYGLLSWQLFVSEMDVSNPPVLRDISAKEKEFYDHIKKLAKELN